MKNFAVFFLLILSVTAAVAQVPARRGQELEVAVQRDSAQKPPITLYKIFSVRGDTTYVDTTLTIQKEYKFNYLRKDNFELLPFANVGQTYNSLAYTFKREELIPDLGARARHLNFMEVEDINYYEVPTPFTEIYFKTVPEQGQNLDSFFTTNISPGFNFSIAYKGLRSLGNYQNSLTSTGNFRTTLNYATKSNRYRARAHFVAQDLLNRENGGLNAVALQQFLSKEEQFEERALLEVKFENAENVLFGKRFYLNQMYDILKSDKNNIMLHHVLDFSDKKYIFRQDAPFPPFGESFPNANLNDQVKLRHINNSFALSFQNATLGRLAAKAGHSYYNYGYNSIIVIGDQLVTNRLIGDNFSAGAEYTNSFGPLAVYGDAMVNFIGDFSGHYLTGGIELRINHDNHLNVEINSNERAPNFNFLLYQSDYLNYNWRNEFSNEATRVLSARLTSPQIANVEASFNQVDNYSYFSRLEEEGTKPFQFGGTLNYIKVKAQREFHYGKFSLDNTVMFQKVTEGEGVFNVPDLITRNSLYFSDHWFQRALFVQTGVTLNYFTSYNMNGYDPVLAEFFVQNEVELGGFPVVDFFFNARVRQTRIFFKLEHLNALLNGNNNFSAPEHPYRDFLIRFGFVWNFFL